METFSPFKIKSFYWRHFFRSMCIFRDIYRILWDLIMKSSPYKISNIKKSKHEVSKISANKHFPQNLIRLPRSLTFVKNFSIPFPTPFITSWNLHMCTLRVDFLTQRKRNPQHPTHTPSHPWTSFKSFAAQKAELFALFFESSSCARFPVRRVEKMPGV